MTDSKRSEEGVALRTKESIRIRMSETDAKRRGGRIANEVNYSNSNVRDRLEAKRRLHDEYEKMTGQACLKPVIFCAYIGRRLEDRAHAKHVPVRLIVSVGYEENQKSET